LLYKIQKKESHRYNSVIQKNLKEEDCVRSNIVAIIALVILIQFNNPADAQNYWGDKHVQPLSSNPNPVIDIIPPKEVKELPDVPEVPVPDSGQSSQISSKQQVYEHNDKNIAASPSKSSQMLELGAKAESVPAGTKLDIAINNNLDARKTNEGDPFSATIKSDVIVNGEIVLPAGTMIRGRVGKVKKPGMFSKSGSILLNFDHIITPLGKQIILDVDLAQAPNVNKKGEIVGGEGFIGAIKDSASSGYNTTKAVTKAGYNAGMAAGKVPVVATVPVSAAIGTVAGTTVFATKSAIAIFNKGGNPKVNSGQVMEITFTDSLDMPVN
jgi:hypothetical protein